MGKNTNENSRELGLYVKSKLMVVSSDKQNKLVSTCSIKSARVAQIFVNFEIELQVVCVFESKNVGQCDGHVSGEEGINRGWGRKWVTSLGNNTRQHSQNTLDADISPYDTWCSRAFRL